MLATNRNALRLWRAVEDRLFPALRPLPYQRLLYYYLLRHTHLERRRTIRCTKSELAHALSISPSTVRDHLRALARDGCIRILERGSSGLRIEVLPPDRISAPRPLASPGSTLRSKARLVQNSFRDPAVRKKLFAREHGRCFYCLSLLRAGSWELDHVVPLSRGGDHSPSNAVASCHECNCAKGETSAPDFLRSLFRHGALSRSELRSRLVALKTPRRDL